MTNWCQARCTRPRSKTFNLGPWYSVVTNEHHTQRFFRSQRDALVRKITFPSSTVSSLVKWTELKIDRDWITALVLGRYLVVLICIMPRLKTIHSSPLSTECMRHWIGSAMFQIKACRLFGTKPLSKPMLGYWQLDPKKQTSVKF